MARPLNPEHSFELLKDGVVKSIEDYFPGGEYKGKKRTLRLKKVSVDDNLGFGDFEKQQEVKEKDGTWAVPVKAEMELVDNATKKVIDRKTMTIAELPKLTPRFSYIVDGKERQVDHQSLLKPGIFTRIADNGVLESRFNTKDPEQRQSMFKVTFDPQSHKYTMKMGNTYVPAYSVMKAMGVSDDEMEKAWGKQILADNRSSNVDADVAKLYKSLNRKDPKSPEEASKAIREQFGSLSVDPEVTKMVTGGEHTNVTGRSMLDATRAILEVNQGKREASGYDDLRFKSVQHTEDYIPTRIRESKRSITAKLNNNIDRVDKIDRIIQKKTFGKPVKDFFTNSSLSTLGDQTNPLSMLTGHSKHTIMGEHGISSAHQVTTDAKIIHPSSYGFFDPSHTPECYTADMEVFTARGWVYWRDVEDDDLFACRVEGRMEFHKAERVIREPYKGKMYGVDGSRIAYTVTPNHRIYARPKYGTLWRIYTAKEAYGRKLRFTSTHGPLCGEESMFELPKPSVVNNKTKLVAPISMDDWCIFLGWFLSEGSNSYDPENSQYHSRIHQKKEEYLPEIEELLDRLPFNWCKNNDYSYTISTRQLAEYLRQFGKAHEKFIPEYAFTASLSAREGMLDALMKGDGRIGSDRLSGVAYNQQVYTTSSPELAKGVERLAISLGYATTTKVYSDNREPRYRDIYEIRLLRHGEWVVDPDRDRSSSRHYIMDFDGKVYCATVPGGLLLVRQGTRVGHWSGNSDRTGVALQIPLGSWKQGNELVTKAVNTKTGKMEIVSASKLAGSNLAFPDEFDLSGKKPKALKPVVTIADSDGQTRKAKASEVDYVLPSHSQMFSATSNLIPFLQNNNGNRVGYGTQQAHQALSLVHREEPLVQSAVSKKTKTGLTTFEGLIGGLQGHRALAGGKVTKVTDTNVYVKKADGSTVKHSLYKDYPLNNKKGVLNSTPLVKVGDEVKKGQVLADTNFTRNGKLAIGTNLRVGYMAADGYNFEDGIVISESAAKKLTSEHMYKKEQRVHQNMHLGKRKHKAHAPTTYKKEQLEAIGDDGVITVGAKVKPGDPLILSVTKNAVTSKSEGLARVSKGLVKDWKDSSIKWEGNTEGTVTKIIRHGNKVKVHVKTEEPMEVGDKLVGRHGNKGIVTRILPDSEMPKYKDPITKKDANLQVMLNPLGVPGRINPGQILETSASLIARKTGKPYEVQNFDPSISDHTEHLEKELKKHGLEAEHEVIDPKTNKPMGKIHLGHQFMMKLDQQVSKKMSARGAGYGNPYDANRAPTTGGGRLGGLGNYAMLAHGATHNLREMQTIKSSMNDEAWRAIQTGDTIPAPRPPYAYEKFTSLLKGMGVDVNKEGNHLILEPLTDDKILEMSNGEVKDPGRMVYGKDLKSEKAGLFDPKVFGKDGGGLRGDKWGHIQLAEPMPNPVFEKAILNLTGMTGKKFNSVLAGKEEVDGKTGPEAIGHMLDKIDVDSKLKDLEAGIKSAPKSKIDKMNKQIRYLRNLKKMKKTPREAYMRTRIPVLPPIMRPLSVLDDGSLNTDDLNALYRGVGLVNNKLKEMDPDLRQLPEHSGNLHASMYDAMKALTGIGTVPSYHYSKRDKLQSIMDKVKGKDMPKHGFFQSKVMSRKQDMSMRSTIVPNQKVKLDEVGIPRAGAVQMFKPHLVRELKSTGMTTLQAHEAIKTNDRRVDVALGKVMKDTPIILKRDPVLHKFGVMAFKPKIAEGNAIEIHPLVTGGFNADFDGNCILGTSKIVLKFSLRSGITLRADNVICRIEEEYEMKFRGDTRVLYIGREDCFIEMEIRDVPHIPETGIKDKNGADVYQVPNGIFVLTYDHRLNQSTVAPVTTFTVEDECTCVRVKTRGGKEVVASANESLCVYDPKTGEVIKFNATKGKGNICPVVAPPLIGKVGDYEYGWMIGAFVSDGFFCGPHKIGYSKVLDSHRDRFYAALCKSGNPSRRTYRDYHEEDIVGESVKDHYSSVSDEIKELFASCYEHRDNLPGRAALRKRLPPDLLTFSEPCLWGILAGLLDGDGSVSRSKKTGRTMIQFSTSSRYLREDVLKLCYFLGIRASFSTTPARGRRNEAYTINLSIVDVGTYKERLNLSHPKKKQVLHSLQPGEMKDQTDLVPIPLPLISLLCKAESGLEIGLRKSLSTIKSSRKPTPYLSRQTAYSIMDKVRHIRPDLEDMWLQWTSLVMSDVRWDIIQSVEPYGAHTVYDICIPSTKIFAANDGLVVWDTMAAFAPATKEAKAEAFKMLPSNNIFNPTYGSVMYRPGHEAQVGIYMLSEKGKKTKYSFKSQAEAAKAMADGKIIYSDQIKIGGKNTTLGRVMLDRALPKEMRGQILNNSKPLDKKEVERLFTEAAHKHKGEFPEMVHMMKDLGNHTVTRAGLSLSLKDIKANKKARDQFFAPIRKKEEAIRSMKGLTKAEKEQKIVDVYRKSLPQFDSLISKDLAARGTSSHKMVKSGGLSKWSQVKQLSGAPVMFEDARGKPVAVPVLKSYSEGLSLAEFMTAAHGARMGTLSKSQGTAQPGALSKYIVNSTMNQQIVGEDCGTTKGILMSVDDPDLADRYLASSVKVGKRTIPAGTLITPEVKDSLRGNKKTKVHVRSPLKCAYSDGICQKCAGLSDDGSPWDRGTNIGVIAAQAMGEPTVQMSMNAFHCLSVQSVCYVRIQKEVPLAISMGELYEKAAGIFPALWDGTEEVIDLPLGWAEIWDNDQWVRLTHVRRHAPADEMYFLSARGSVSICQGNHPIMAAPSEKDDPRMTPASQSEGHFINTSRIPSNLVILPEEECAEGIPGYIAGMYAAEGNINYRPCSVGAEKKPYSVVFTMKSEAPERDKLRRELVKWRGKYGTHGDKGHVLNSLSLGRQFERLLGRYSHGKHLPWDFMNYSRDWLKRFLCGYLDGDGSVVSKPEKYQGYLVAESTSFMLVQQLSALCRLLDIHATVQQRPWRSHSVHQSFTIRVHPTKEQCEELLGGSVKAQSMSYWKAHTELLQDGIEKIRVVKPTVYQDEWVYDATTETGTLTVGGMHHHNTGGVIAPGEYASLSRKGGAFGNLKNLLNMPEKIPNSAKLAPISGKISSIKKDPAGGVRIAIRHGGTTRDAWAPTLLPGVKKGKAVKAGDALSPGLVNPRELLPLAGVDAVKGSLTNQIHGTYNGVRRRHIETVVRSMTDLAKIKDSGDNPDLLPGDVVSSARVHYLNSKLPKGRRPASFQPVLKGVEHMPLHMQEDWAARMNLSHLKNTVVEGSLQGWKSDIHGRSPVPGLMYGAEFGLNKDPGKPY